MTEMGLLIAGGVGGVLLVIVLAVAFWLRKRGALIYHCWRYSLTEGGIATGKLRAVPLVLGGHHF